MESFFLSETLKYLYLLHANATDVPNFYIFTTEGHLLPPFLSVQQPFKQTPLLTLALHYGLSAMRYCLAISYRVQSLLHHAFTHFALVDLGDIESPPDLCANNSSSQQHLVTQQSTAADVRKSDLFRQCSEICTVWSPEEAEQRVTSLQHILPLLPFQIEHSLILR